MSKFNMLREIREQPETIKDSLESALGCAREVKDLIEEKVARKPRCFFLVGCGTSYYAAMAGKYAIQALSRIQSVAYPASEFRDFETMGKGDALIAVSQSGETGDVITAAHTASKKGHLVIAVTNGEKSKLAEISQAVVLTRAGKEIAVPMTKTYTALLAALFSIAVVIGEDTRLSSELNEIPHVVRETIKTSEPRILELLRQLSNVSNIILVGRGPSYPTALEASLKLKETALVHAEGFPSPELRHGPKALLDPGTPLIALSSSDKLDEATLGLTEELKGTGIAPILVGDCTDSTVRIQRVNYYLTPIPYIVPLQLLSYYLATQKGLDPDNPRNLTKITTAT